MQRLTEPDAQEPEEVALGRLHVMERTARIGEIEIIPTPRAEPVILNAIRDMQRFLEQEQHERPAATC